MKGYIGPLAAPIDLNELLRFQAEQRLIEKDRRRKERIEKGKSQQNDEDKNKEEADGAGDGDDLLFPEEEILEGEDRVIVPPSPEEYLWEALCSGEDGETEVTVYERSHWQEMLDYADVHALLCQFYMPEHLTLKREIGRAHV